MNTIFDFMDIHYNLSNDSLYQEKHHYLLIFRNNQGKFSNKSNKIKQTAMLAIFHLEVYQAQKLYN